MTLGKMEASLRIQRFQQLPSAIDFASQIESTNVPAVFEGCIKDWKAFSKWNPSAGGLDYLEERVGASVVEAMLSRAAPVFYGDLRSHERVSLPLSTFLGFCKGLAPNNEDPCNSCSLPRTHSTGETEINQGKLQSEQTAPEQLYLAQVPIMNVENEEKGQLELLKEDIHTPSILGTKQLSSINLWMNNAKACSSTHYDPHHNLLCVVAGCKKVVLWPPSATPMLYPMPLYGEASNHSSVALANPDFFVHPRAQFAMENSQMVILHAGDALFIPEGWFHQVDSEDLTIAVNFWWQSSAMCSFFEHMDAYYLRRIVRRLTEREMNQVFLEASSADVGSYKKSMEMLHSGESDCKSYESGKRKDLEGRELRQGIPLHELESNALQALHELVSLVHDRVNVSDQNEKAQEVAASGAALSTNKHQNGTLQSDVLHLEDDPVAKILWTLKPSTLEDIFLVLVHNFPRTLEALILHSLSPIGAEVLTRKFDEMDQLIAGENRNKFYEAFYSVFDDQFLAMDAILNGKESFANQAFKNVLDKYLGVKF